MRGQRVAGLVLGLAEELREPEVEQLGSAPIDGRVDLYAASVMIFELIAGRRPFQAVGSHDAVHELRATLLEPPPSLAAAKPELPLAAALDPILVRGLAKDPAARFESAAEMGRARRC